MNKVLVGTTSWTEKTLIESGLFYPSAVKTPEERLKYYATKFPVTEVDSSYYSLPSERNAAAWVERTPKNFVFHLKAFRLFTGHQSDPSKFPKDIQQALGPREKARLLQRLAARDYRRALGGIPFGTPTTQNRGEARHRRLPVSELVYSQSRRKNWRGCKCRLSSETASGLTSAGASAS